MREVTCACQNEQLNTQERKFQSYSYKEALSRGRKREDPGNEVANGRGFCPTSRTRNVGDQLDRAHKLWTY